MRGCISEFFLVDFTDLPDFSLEELNEISETGTPELLVESDQEETVDRTPHELIRDLSESLQQTGFGSLLLTLFMFQLYWFACESSVLAVDAVCIEHRPGVSSTGNFLSQVLVDGDRYHALRREIYLRPGPGGRQF